MKMLGATVTNVREALAQSQLRNVEILGNKVRAKCAVVSGQITAPAATVAEMRYDELFN